MFALERTEGSALVDVRAATAAIATIEGVATVERVRAAITPFSWWTCLLPTPQRKALQALYAFDCEVGGIAGEKSLVDDEAGATGRLARRNRAALRRSAGARRDASSARGGR